jgi:putative ABC transport system permease protein
MISDLRFALRHLLKAPGFTLTVTLVLALGIGATTAIFSVINAVLIHPFPYPDGNKILFVGSNRTDQPDSQMPVAYLDYLEWKRQSQTTDHLAYATGTAATLTGVPEPTSLRNAGISADAWALLGMQPVLGRVFTADEDNVGASPVAVLSHATWQKYFNSDATALGRTLTLDGKVYTVIGVMPPRFKFWAGDVWTPVGLQADSDTMRSRLLRMDAWVVTKPKPGLTMKDVSAELEVFARQLAQQFPDTNNKVGVMMRPLAESVSGQLRNPLLVLLSAVAAVLLIACANVANLFLARTSARQREFAVRAALGASRGQLIRQTLVECLPLALLGGLAGLGLAAWGLDALLALLPADTVPAEALVKVDGQVMAFSLVLTLGTLILFALFPALESSRAALGSKLQEGARGTASLGTSRVRAGLIVAEVSLSLVLLVAAGLLIRSLVRMQNVDVGFNRDNLVVVPIQLSEARYGGSEQATTFFETVVDRLESLPGIAAAAAATSAPYAGVNGMPLVVEGKTYTDLNQLDGLIFSLVTRDYFSAQGLRLVRGRIFTDTDRAGTQPVIILNEAAVKKFLPEGDPLGKRVMLGAPDNLLKPGLLPAGLDHFQWATVIGVVRNARYFGPQNDPPAAAYVPVRQAWDYPTMRRAMVLLIRTHDRPLEVVPALRSIVKSLDASLPIGRVALVQTLIGESIQFSSFIAILLSLFASVAFCLAAVGIYGVVSWNVTQRTREIGIRQALGAGRGSVLRLVIGQSMKVVGLGVGIGLAGSLALAASLRAVIFDISAFDPLTFVTMGVLLSGTALFACWLPARRATKVDPMVALRAE